MIHRGAGAYICGEETALLESLEGKRGQPRSKPPFPPIQGLYAAPTLINNVESITTIPPILDVGPAEYAQIGAPPDSTGTRLFCLSGNVERPGVYEAPHGITVRHLIDDIGGGIPGGHDAEGRDDGRLVVPGDDAGQTSTRRSTPTRSARRATSSAPASSR